MESNTNVDDVSSAKLLPNKKRKQVDQDKIVENFPKKKRIKPKCSTDGCGNFVVKGGHGAKVKTCSHDGCNSYAKKGGVCIKHGAKVKTCSHEGCTNFAQQRGLCRRHGAYKSLDTVEVVEAESSTVSDSTPKKKPRRKCSADGCTSIAQKGGLCRRHGAYKPPDTEEVAASTLPDPIPSICLPCNDDHKYDEETDDEIEYETSDQPIKIKTEAIKKEDDNAYNQETDDEESVEKVPV